jgi:hypothetical protein
MNKSCVLCPLCVNLDYLIVLAIRSIMVILANRLHFVVLLNSTYSLVSYLLVVSLLDPRLIV